MAYCTWKSCNFKFDPPRAFEILQRRRNCFFLDSSLSGGNPGRYSFLGIDPFHILQTKNEDPFNKLRELLSGYKIDFKDNPIPFPAGAVGFLSYDLGFLLENKLQRHKKDGLNIPDSFFAFYNTVIVMDNLRKRLYISAVGFPEKKSHLAKLLCESNIKKIQNLLCKSGLSRAHHDAPQLKTTGWKLRSNFKQEEYLSAVKKAKRYIKDGDIYQVNLSQRFETRTSFSASEIYQRLRKISPSHFGAYLDAGSFQILSSSPERFIRLERDSVLTCPMKGTRPRGMTKPHDTALKKELVNSKKDKAELIMIVDLERNDLGRVCEYGSIKVNSLRRLEEYSTVFQTTSQISAKLHRGKDGIDLMRACFPGGSITGCPKIRAMEIIEELEPSGRNVYTGSLGYISFSGNMDFNILIRTILKKKDKLYFGVGGGIVSDSKPILEYEETLVKARAMIEAIGGR